MITCYLDSQDYSVLTDPKTLTADRVQMRNALCRFAQERKVQFVFSATSVCEGVSLTPESSHLSELKAELLSELCGRNALFSFDRLIEQEAISLSKRCDHPCNIIDMYGNWFPDISVNEAIETSWEKMRQLAESDLRTMGFSRQQRRAHVRKLIKNGGPRGDFKSQIQLQGSTTLAHGLAERYPMKPENAEIMARYFLGRGSQKEFMNALIENLRDPRWMMNWFSTNHALSSPIAEIVRKPGRELGENLRRLAAISIQMASSLKHSGADSDPLGKRGEVTLRWNELQNNLLTGVIKRIAHVHDLSLAAIAAEDVDKYCPGLSTTIRSLYSSVWENVAGGRTEQPSNSQPVDAMHAMYAPYVRIFRADRFMAPHVQKYVTKHGTIVVSKLSNLVRILEMEIEREAGKND